MEKKKFFIVRAYEWLDDKLQSPTSERWDRFVDRVKTVLGVLLVFGLPALFVVALVSGKLSISIKASDLKMVGAGVVMLFVVAVFQYVCRSALLGLVLFFAVCALINHW